MAEQDPNEQWTPPRDADDACSRCGGSLEATGGKPTDGTRLCQKCVCDDWLNEEANGYLRDAAAGKK